MLSDLSQFGDVYAYATQKFSIFAMLYQQNYQQNVTLENYDLLTMP
ncbi:MAG: hypothetical protein V7K38_10455 [Nostoc sp.]